MGGTKLIKHVALLVGVVAILALLGVVGYAPPYLAFFISGLTVILFPGMVTTSLITGPPSGLHDLPGRLIAWFVSGTCVVTGGALLGLILHVRLQALIVGLVLGYLCLIVALLALSRRLGHMAATSAPRAGPSSRTAIYITLLAIAVGGALLTLLTPRNFDDWFYLAYIKDYVVGRSLGAEDALFHMGNPAPPRIWFGGAWWVLEAILSRVSAVDPVECRQIYMPVLILPFSVLALFALTRSVFRSASTGLLAVCLQVLFYLSSAFPQKSVGWFFFCRIAQDKAVSFFVIVPFAAALALRVIKAQSGDEGSNTKNLYTLYSVAVVTSLLVHGMGPVWCSLLIVPFGLTEWVRRRTNVSVWKPLMLIMPLIACGFVLVLARRLMGEFLLAPRPDAIPASEAISSFYLPGHSFGNAIEAESPVVWIFKKGWRILNPLFVTRYPFAIAGLALTFALIPRLRSEFAARFLFTVTIAVLLLAYTPAGAALVSALMSSRLLFRLSWLFPWGLIAAFLISRLKLRPLVVWLMVAAIGLALARGNPYNYASRLLAVRSRGRPSPDAVDVLKFLGSQPAPQGAVFATEVVSSMIAAYVPSAIPVNFREEGLISREEVEAMESEWRRRKAFFKAVRDLDIKYVITDRQRYLARCLAGNELAFTLTYSNQSFSIWRVEAAIDTIPLGDLIR